MNFIVLLEPLAEVCGRGLLLLLDGRGLLILLDGRGLPLFLDLGIIPRSVVPTSTRHHPRGPGPGLPEGRRLGPHLYTTTQVRHDHDRAGGGAPLSIRPG